MAGGEGIDYAGLMIEEGRNASAKINYYPSARVGGEKTGGVRIFCPYQ
jgi:hypothetical protein